MTALSLTNESFLPQIFKGKRKNHNRLKEPMAEKSHKYLSKQDILRVTKSLKQNICVDMLQNGNHRSFSKFFHVLSLDQEQRDAFDLSLADILPPLLEERSESMHKMKQHLTQAEHAERSGSWSVVCEQYLALGLYFSSEKDLWLRLHFLHICADREHGRCSRAATEARAQLAEIYLQKGDLEEALQQAECCLHQAVDGCWLDSSGFSLKTRAQHALCGIYTRLADAPLQSNNYAKSIELLQRALDIAKDTGNQQIEGEVTYKLGVTHQLSGDHSTAKKFLNAYVKICQELDNALGLGKAYKAIAKSLESEGDTEEIVQRLQKLTDGSVNCLQCDLVDACLSLGNIFSNMGEFAQACEYYQRGYEGAVALGDVSLLQKTQVLLGGAKAHSMIELFSSDVLSASRPSLRRLFDWKERRDWDQSAQEDSKSTNNKTLYHQ